MAQITIHCQGFNGGFQHLNGTRPQMDVPLWKFLGASITLGFQRFRDVLDAGPRLWMHRLGQGFSGVSYLHEEHDRFYLEKGHIELDGSEKSAMSYWQGMVFAKLTAAQVLDVRWLAHADALERAGVLQRNTNTDKRADMAGHDDQQQWHVIEAKGYSSHPGLEALRKAKDQAAVVAAINGQPPATTSACVTRLWQKPLNILLDDPPPTGKEKWTIKTPEFWEHYYGGIRDYVQKQQFKKGLPDFPGFAFASLTPLLGSNNLKSDANWSRAMIGLPEPLMKDVTMAPDLLKRLLLDAPSTGVMPDGIAFVGGPSGWDSI